MSPENSDVCVIADETVPGHIQLLQLWKALAGVRGNEWKSGVTSV